MAKKYEPPKKGVSDGAHALARAGLGAIPLAGAASIELLSAIVTPSLEKRRDDWMNEVGEGLRELEDRVGVILEELGSNDQFIDIAIDATQIALKTSIKEKRKALKNVILNTALPEPPEESLQKLFLSFIDTLTVWHIKLTKLFYDPQEYCEENNLPIPNIQMGALSHLVEDVFPDLRGKRDLYDLIWKDLYSRALVNTDGLHVMMTGSGMLAKRTTQIGDMFLEYIKNPIEDR